MYRRENNIEMDLKDKGYEDVVWFHLVQDLVQEGLL
jgi:hypothetical protein